MYRMGVYFFILAALASGCHRVTSEKGSQTRALGAPRASLVSSAYPEKNRAKFAQVSFDGDAKANLAIRNGANGVFQMTFNPLSPGYYPAVYYSGFGFTPVGSDWRVLLGDFNGDGYGDYADYHIPSGNTWIHVNIGNSFDPNAWAFIPGLAVRADEEVLVGDFNGDGRTDFAERYLNGGAMKIRLNTGPGSSFPVINLDPYWSQFATMIGPDWTTVVADFTGDGRDDVADLHVPSGRFWVHRSILGLNILYSGANIYYRGTFASEVSSIGQTAAGGLWKPIFGDFDGDGYADFADVWGGNGAFWVHRNLSGTAFNANADAYRETARPSAAYQIIGE